MKVSSKNLNSNDKSKNKEKEKSIIIPSSLTSWKYQRNKKVTTV